VKKQRLLILLLHLVFSCIIITVPIALVFLFAWGILLGTINFLIVPLAQLAIIFYLLREAWRNACRVSIECYEEVENFFQDRAFKSVFKLSDYLLLLILGIITFGLPFYFSAQK